MTAIPAEFLRRTTTRVVRIAIDSMQVWHDSDLLVQAITIPGSECQRLKYHDGSLDGNIRLQRASDYLSTQSLPWLLERSDALTEALTKFSGLVHDDGKCVSVRAEYLRIVRDLTWSTPIHIPRAGFWRVCAPLLQTVDVWLFEARPIIMGSRR